MQILCLLGLKEMIDKMNKKAAGMDEEEVPELDFIELHSLVMQRFLTTTPEGIDLVLWGDLRIMFEETADDDIWKNQEK
ncbi:hypothetical protein Tco_0388955 [Tanacetum coccineum]